MLNRHLKSLYLELFLLFSYVSTSAQNYTIPGEVTTIYPTLLNIGVDWKIKGDNNLNGTVTVHFRQKGTYEWKEGMNLKRVPAGHSNGFKWSNKHSGSIFDLIPDTRYEIKLNLYDPDGGSAEKLVEVSTRPEPVVDINAVIVDLHPGVYDTLVAKSGTKEHPVVYLCSGGDATFGYIDLRNKEWVCIEGLKVVNLKVIDVEDHGVGIQMDGARNCVIRGCSINSVYGIVADKPGAFDCYISDNIITGINNWTDESMGASGKNMGEGVQITGSGNVICYNRVTGFRDCISTMEDTRATEQYGFDIYNNDIELGLDDAIESDFCMSNCRIFRNRITNCYVGISSQPGLGGPNYFIRNVMYNVIHGAFKLKRGSKGDVALHNTVIKVGAGLGCNDPMDFEYFRNNLVFGGQNYGRKWGGYGTGNPSGTEFFSPGEHSSFDYDAVGVCGTDYIATIGNKPFALVEPHGIENIRFEDTFQGVVFPESPVPEKDIPDLRPISHSKSVDAGMRIPNVNDDFKGSAPDCGAYEEGQELPHYGPRDIKQEFCGIPRIDRSGKYVCRKPVLEGEVEGINTWFIELQKDMSYHIEPSQNSVSLYLITHGSGVITQGDKKYNVNGINLFVPSITKDASVRAGQDSMGMLEIKIVLTSSEYQSLMDDTSKLPYFADYTQCQQYREAIKSEKTISRMILPENIIPRFCLGSVETTGPDKVGAHTHPMLEQQFLGLRKNDCLLIADGVTVPFRENYLVHIPLGSMHGVIVSEGKSLNYIWMDLFRSQEGMKYIRENHFMKDKHDK